jgi:hypothetical protein
MPDGWLAGGYIRKAMIWLSTPDLPACCAFRRRVDSLEVISIIVVQFGRRTVAIDRQVELQK